MIKAISTRYGSRNYRSRTEARWAIFFDCCGIPFEYEALDHQIFGNVHGMKSPYWDNRFYWLNGRLYTWIGGLGAQLQSQQWFHPKPGETRRRTRSPLRTLLNGL